MSAVLDRLKTLRAQMVCDMESAAAEEPPREPGWLSLLAQVQASIEAVQAVEREDDYG